MASFWRELRRRNVFKVAVVYAVVAWVLVEVSVTTFPILRLPEWAATFVTVLALIGFPLAVILAWAFELTPEGIKLDKHVERDESVTHVAGRKPELIIIALLILVLLFVFVDQYLLKGPPAPSAERTTEGPVESSEKSIAVLSFENRSAAEENAAFFADGVHDDLLTLLSKLSEIRVISRTSVERFRDTDQSIAEIAAALGVTTILEGGVQQAGNRVRINVQLIDAAAEKQLWAETYDRELTAINVFEIQSEIAANIADALKAKLTSQEKITVAAVPTENLEAYRTYLLGKRHLGKITDHDLKEAVLQFQQAINLDPEFAAAYVGLANAYLYMVDFGTLLRTEAVERAQPLLAKALELDPQSGEAYAALGGIKFYERDYAGSEAAYIRSLELKPNYALAHQWYGDLLSRLGRPEEALQQLRAGLNLDPLSPGLHNEIADALSALGRFDEALAQLQTIIEMDPGSSLAFWRIGRINAYGRGRLDDAILWSRRSITLDPGDAWGFAYVGQLYLELGDEEEAERWIDRAVELSPDSGFSNSALASLRMHLGNEAEAMLYTKRALQEETFSSYWRRLGVLRNADLRDERYKDARERYEQYLPELFDDDPTIDGTNYLAAIDLALVMKLTNEPMRAEELLNGSFDYIQTIPRLGWEGYGIADVHIFALQGKTDAAFAAIRQAIDQGWRPIGQYPLDRDPNLAALREEPAFQAILDELEADMSAQLERVTAMDRAGELDPLPELAPATP